MPTPVPRAMTMTFSCRRGRWRSGVLMILGLPIWLPRDWQELVEGNAHQAGDVSR